MSSQKRNIHGRLKRSKIKKSEIDIQGVILKNNVWRRIKRFTKLQTQHHTSEIHGRTGLTYTPLKKATETAEVYENQSR
jgi:CRISPR/Cas system-associated protein Cas10 (large subunit of type III CRISPR-Cas system)